MTHHDDLTRIKGIGPKHAASLRRAGVVGFLQLGQMTTAAINEIIGRKVACESWLQQARKFDTKLQRAREASRRRCMTVDQMLAAIDAKEKKRRPKKMTCELTSVKQPRKRSRWRIMIDKAELMLQRAAHRLFVRHPEIVSIDLSRAPSRKRHSLPEIRITIDASKTPVGNHRIPDQIEGFPVAIVAGSSGSFFLAARSEIQGGKTFRRSAAPLGQGTIGVMVQDLGGIKPTPAFLTAGHVCRGGLNRVDDVVATMKRDSTVVGEMRLTPRLYVENDVADAALVLANPDIAPIPFLPRRSNLKFRPPRRKDVGARIEKLGRNQVSGVGVIRSISCGRTRINPDFDNPVGYVVHHLLIERVSGSFALGDSGAAIVLGKKWIVGLLRAVTENGQLILASRFDMIKKNLVAFKMGAPE